MPPTSAAVPQLLLTPPHRRLQDKILHSSADDHLVTLPTPQDFPVLPDVGHCMVKAQIATAGLCRFAFSAVLFLSQLHCLRCEFGDEHSESLVRRCCLGEEWFHSLSATTLHCCSSTLAILKLLSLQFAYHKHIDRTHHRQRQPGLGGVWQPWKSLKKQLCNLFIYPFRCISQFTTGIQENFKQLLLIHGKK